MHFQTRPDRIWLEDPSGKEIAYVSFPAREEGVVSVDHTVVDASLRGQGVAGQLLEALAAQLRSDGRKAIVQCVYAAKWFSQHPEEADLLFPETP